MRPRAGRRLTPPTTQPGRILRHHRHTGRVDHYVGLTGEGLVLSSPSGEIDSEASIRQSRRAMVPMHWEGRSSYCYGPVADTATSARQCGGPDTCRTRREADPGGLEAFGRPGQV